MNALVFAVFAWIALGLERGLKPTLQIGPGQIAPSFVAILAVYVAASATPRAAQWACLALGLLVDLTSPMPRGDAGTLTVVGPNALGAFLAAHLTLSMRGLMFRQNPLSLGFLTVLGMGIWQAVVTGVFTLRHVFGDPVEWHATSQVLGRMGASVYTALLALPLALALMPAGSLLGFPSHAHRFGRRA